MTQALNAVDFADITGLSQERAEVALRALALPPLAYRALDDREMAAATVNIDSVLRDGRLRRAGEDDATVWRNGWAEIAQSLAGRQITLAALQPQYFRGEAICRLRGRYVQPLATSFEYDSGLVLRQMVFDEYLRDHTTVVEYGCGTGLNLLLLALRYPTMRLIGCDWAVASGQIIAAMARQMQRPIEGHLFNMLSAEGWSGEANDRRTAILTVHAMEQLGSQWRPFFNYIVRQRPALCLHMEPLFELYDERSEFDVRARRYHAKRGYLQGYYPHLLQLARNGEIELLAARRVPFGGAYHEAYSLLVWRPRA